MIRGKVTEQALNPSLTGKPGRVSVRMAVTARRVSSRGRSSGPLAVAS